MRWQQVEVLEHRQDQEEPFRNVTRQVLFDDPSLASHLRYFEAAPGARHSSLLCRTHFVRTVTPA